MSTKRMTEKKRSVHQPEDDNAPTYWTSKTTRRTRTTSRSIHLNCLRSMPCLLPSQTQRNIMSPVLCLGWRKAKHQHPETDPPQPATSGPGLASAQTPPHLLVPRPRHQGKKRRHLSRAEANQLGQKPEAEDDHQEAKGDSLQANTPTPISLRKR